jgi:predicted nucleic acid-binding protein
VLLLDNSAWSHMGQDRLAEDRRQQVAEWMADGEIAACLPFLLEAGYSARSAAAHHSMMAGLTRLPRIQITAQIEEHTIAAQHELALAGHHRLPPADLLIAACAQDAGAGVLHYDGDYDVICQLTGLTFKSEWLAPRGTL